MIKKENKKNDHLLKIKVYYENIFVNFLIIWMFLLFLNNEWKLN